MRAVALNKSAWTLGLSVRCVVVVGGNWNNGRSCGPRKRNVLAISRQARRISKAKSVTPHMARSMMSRMGSLKHCHSRNYYIKNIKPLISVRKLKEVISIEDRKRNHAAVAV